MSQAPLLRRAVWAVCIVFCLCALSGSVSAGDIFSYETENRSYSVGLYTDIFTIEESRDGGRFIGGHAFEKDTSDHAFLMKTDADGSVLWQKIYPTSRVVSIKELNDGRIIGAALDEQVNPDSPTGAITGSGYLFMTDPDGALIWDEELPGDAPAAILLSDIEIILVGWRWAPADDPEGVSGFFSRYNLSGARIDTVAYEGVSIHDIIATDDGGYLLIGNTGDPMETVFVRYGHLTKINSTGGTEWTKTYNERSLFAITGMDGGYLIVGGTNPYGYSEGEAWAIGISHEGTLLWEEKLQGYAAYGVAPFGDEFLIAGATGPGNPFIASITSGGDLTDSHRLLEADGRFTAVAPISDGRVAVGGWSRHTGKVDGWLLAFSPIISEPTQTPGFGLIAAALGIAGAVVLLQSKKRD
ncbi:MAG: hypothetical protein Q7J09_04125, partial [Methanocalculus sp.]|uniref:hypothetical protein n=1 Tax=Methanocalculus sp. TaxID=2004547 RepID=UPI00271D15BF